jgi:hypothetical protein
MSAVGVRMWLDDPPPLPSPAELATLAEAAAARTADRHERMELLLRCLRDRLGDDAEGLLRLLDAGGGDAVVDVLSVRVVTGDLVLTAREAVELHALAAGR